MGNAEGRRELRERMYGERRLDCERNRGREDERQRSLEKLRGSGKRERKEGIRERANRRRQK